MEFRPMTAEGLLQEIKSESLQHLLTSVRSETSPPGCTGIPALDAHFLSNISYRGSRMSSLNRGDVIEIQGPSASGKSHLLYHLLITCLLPSHFVAFNSCGWGKAAIIFDTDLTFDVRRFHKLMVARIARSSPDSVSEHPSLGEKNASQSVDHVATQCLRNLHIFRPASSFQLAATLMHLPSYHSAHIAESEIGLLGIDSLSAFYWSDRFTTDKTRAAPGSSLKSGHTPASHANPLQHVLTALGRLRLSHGPVIVFTNWGLNPLPAAPGSNLSEPASLFYKQHLHPAPSLSTTGRPGNLTSIPPATDNSAFVLPLIHHITLAITPIPSFPSDIPVREAQDREEAYRRELVGKGQVTGFVRTAGSSSISKFTFCIGDGDLFVGDTQ